MYNKQVEPPNFNHYLKSRRAINCLGFVRNTLHSILLESGIVVVPLKLFCPQGLVVPVDQVVGLPGAASFWCFREN